MTGFLVGSRGVEDSIGQEMGMKGIVFVVNDCGRVRTSGLNSLVWRGFSGIEQFFNLMGPTRIVCFVINIGGNQVEPSRGAEEANRASKSLAA